MFKGKPTKVIMTGKAKEEFDDLNKIVGEEIVYFHFLFWPA